MSTPDPRLRDKAKRDFSVTPEPVEGTQRSGLALSFVVQKHWASSLHCDFRLELAGTLRRWAVPKGPSVDPKDKRRAVQAEDHPLSYAGFEGTIPARHCGAGKVIVWDRGTWVPSGDAAQGLLDGNLKFELRGHKRHGRRVPAVRNQGRRRPAARANRWRRDQTLHPQRTRLVVEAGEPARSICRQQAAERLV